MSNNSENKNRHYEFEKSGFRYNLMMRSIEILNIVFMTLAFLVTWIVYYQSRNYIPFYFWGNWVIVIVFLIIYWQCARAYDVFQVYNLRIQELAYSQMIACLITDVIMYFIMCILGRGFLNFVPILILLAAQGGIAVVWAFWSHRWYFDRYKPLKTIIIHGPTTREIDKRFKTADMAVRFDVRDITNVEKVEGDLKVLRDYEVVFLKGIQSELRDEIIKYCLDHDIVAYVIPFTGDLLMSGAQKVNLYNLPLLKVDRYNPAPEYLFFKRFLDIIFSAVGLVVASPLMIVIAIIIRASDGGDVFYRQVRLTKNAKRFTIVKFRSMVMGAEEETGPTLSTGEDDERVTKFGHFLRRSRFDELPQLVNILKGEMSFVGPRPERPELAEEYKEELPDYELRLQVRAGLTGYAQVHGKYNTTPKDKLLLDLMYISKPNLAEDAKIVFNTVKTIFLKEKTEGVEEGRTTAIPRSKDEK